MAPCRSPRKVKIQPKNEINMTPRKAHEIKAGDRINGVEVFESVRRTIGGYYIPMIDGSRI